MPIAMIDLMREECMRIVIAALFCIVVISGNSFAQRPKWVDSSEWRVMDPHSRLLAQQVDAAKTVREQQRLRKDADKYGIDGAAKLNRIDKRNAGARIRIWPF